LRRRPPGLNESASETDCAEQRIAEIRLQSITPERALIDLQQFKAEALNS